MGMHEHRRITELEEKIKAMLPFNYDNFLQLSKKVTELEDQILQLSKAKPKPSKKTEKKDVTI